MEWLPATSTTSDPARRDMVRWGCRGDHPVLGRDLYQLGLVRQAESVTCPVTDSSVSGANAQT
jgi:hypothetical protein